MKKQIPQNAVVLILLLQMGPIVPVMNKATEIQALAAQPLLYSLNERIRPLLDVVDRLRSLKCSSNDHICYARDEQHLPPWLESTQQELLLYLEFDQKSRDQSSGKSSVLESLAGINLPRGQGICTRVPLILSLQDGSLASLTIEYAGKSVQTDESSVTRAIEAATREIAGESKGISNTPITLIVRKPGVPDLTMVDLPGITRVAVRGQPGNIYEQVRDIIMEYITPEESIILNVISASVDFSTSESIRMSQMVDKTGHRTLIVVTKSNKSPEGLLEKASIIAKSLPSITRQINDKLNSNIVALNEMPRNFTSAADAMTGFVRILGSTKDSLRKILIAGEFDDFRDEAKMHCTSRLAELMDGYFNNLQQSTANEGLFLMEEVTILEDSKGIWLPNFLPRSVFLTFLHGKMRVINPTPAAFIEGVWDYLEEVVSRVMMNHYTNFPQLHSTMRRAA
ncbi:hypothetical protein V2J09_020813 [Rumex salicifolius]